MVENFPWYVMYQYAVYWSLQTSTACGYGDVTPKNPPEVLYCNIVIIVNTLFFAYYINGIWVIIGDLHEPANRFSENWGNLKNMIKDIEVPKNVKNKISSFLR